MDPYAVLIRPVVTEKVHIQKEADNKITFKVHKNANKFDIKKAVEKILSVNVLKVNIMNRIGKKKRLGKFEGRRSGYKKAVVTLAKGDKVPMFEA